MSEHVINVTDATFEQQVLQANKAVLVDFWAAWCGPCRTLAPIFEEVATSHHNQVIFAKMDVDSNQGVPSRYGVMSIPTLILFRSGQVVEMKLGALTKSQLIAFIESNL